MYIHNFFCDLLLSVRILFDKLVFLPDYIKTYEFNISNRTFSLIKNDYKTEFELPACIVSLNSDTPSFGERPSVIQRTTVPNYNMVPVLSDNNNIVIHLQEEQTQVSVSIVINCESQLQAKEAEFKIRRVLPLGKFIQELTFTSFLEVPAEVLFGYGLNPKEDNITNLFNKLNKNTGSVDYCYSVFYKPLIRLESINTTIDANQRSFPVNLDLTFQIQMPMFLAVDHLPKSSVGSIGLDFVRMGNEPISDIPTKILQSNEYLTKTSSTVVRRSLIIYDLYDFEYIEFLELSKCSFAISFNKKDFIISPDFTFNFLCSDGIIRTNIPSTLVDAEINKVIFEFTIDEKNIYFNPSLTRPIILMFVEKIM